MKIREIMTENPATVTPEDSLEKVARLMVDCDCGALPVVGSSDSSRPEGIITDRDIVARVLAQGQNPLDKRVRDAMTSPAVTASADSDLREVGRMMRDKQIRRVVIVDQNGGCVGIVSQADVAMHAPEDFVGEVVEEISQPTGSGSGMRSGGYNGNGR